MKLIISTPHPEKRTRGSAFTIVEVVIASGIFCVCIFSILGIMSQGLRTAASLKNSGPTAGMVVAQLAVGTQLEEGSGTSSFGDSYPDYEYMTNVLQYGSNGFFQVDAAVIHKGHVDSTLTTYLYRPNSKARR